MSETVITATTKDVVIKGATTTLNDEQLKSIYNATVELVPAPGMGKCLIFHGAVWNKKAFTAGYTGIEDTDGIGIAYEGRGELLDRGFFRDDNASITDLSLLLSTTDAYVFQDWPAVPRSGVYVTPTKVNIDGTGENKAFVVTSFFYGVEWTGGHADNEIEVTVYYSVFDV